MAKPKLRNLPDLSHLAVAGNDVLVRATPGAARDGLSMVDGVLKISVTAIAEDGKANAAVRAILAKAMHVAPTDLTLIRGHTARDKVFRYDPSRN